MDSAATVNIHEQVLFEHLLSSFGVHIEEWNSWITWLSPVELPEETPHCSARRPPHCLRLVMDDASDFPTSSPILVLFLFLNDGPPSGCEVVSQCNFNLHFPND